MSRIALQRGPLAPAAFRNTILRNSLALGQYRALSRVEVARPSFWKSIVPKFLRPTQQDDPFGTIAAKKAKKAKEWNPATFFIVIFLLIGSMSIQMIALKKDFATFVRRTDVRIGLLREVVEKLQVGEKVDVKKTLGTGNPEKELEWEEVLKEIEQGEVTRKQRKKKPTEPNQESAVKSTTTPVEPVNIGQPSQPSSAAGFY